MLNDTGVPELSGPNEKACASAFVTLFWSIECCCDELGECFL